MISSVCPAYRRQKWRDYEVKGPALPRSSPSGVWGSGGFTRLVHYVYYLLIDLLSLPSFDPDLFLEIRPLTR